MTDITQGTKNIPNLQSTFDQLREVDTEGKEWWNSRKLARVMGYGKYWNFERVIAKAQAWTSRKGPILPDAGSVTAHRTTSGS